jgi:WD40 repeat protein
MKKRPHRILLFGIGMFVSVVIGLYMSSLWLIRLDIEQVDPTITMPNQTSQAFTQLSPTTVIKLQEIVLLDAPNFAKSVVALTQRNDNGHLLVVYGNGIFRQWDIQTQKITAEFNFISASQSSVSFNADGLLVITPGKILPSGSNGYNIWDTQTGERISCWGSHCPDGDPYDARFIDIGLLLDPRSRWIIEYTETGGSAINLGDNPLGGISIPESKTGARIKRLTLDRSGMYLAYALDNGSVRIFETEPFLGMKRGVLNNRELSYPSPSLQTQIRAFNFDDTRTWLALLSDSELTVWDLRKYIFPRKLRIPVNDGNAIAFDHAGSMLAIGMETGISILDLENKEQIIELDVQNVTTLYFTIDNRLLVWGDTDGGIHLWGVK